MATRTYLLQLHRPTPRLAMSLLEVMIALSVLTIGIFASLSHFMTLSSMRKQTGEIATARNIVAALAERFQGCRWEVVGVSTAPWSLPRAEPGSVTTVANDPMMDDASLSAADRPLRGLQSLGLAQEASNLPDLRVYVEYYRALTILDESGNADTTKPGIMDREPGGTTYANADAFESSYHFESRWDGLPVTLAATTAAARATYRLAATALPTAQVGENDPVCIRILATWGQSGHFAVFTARKR